MNEADYVTLEDARRAKATNGAAAAYRFTLVPFAKIPFATTAAYLVRGIIPREGLIVVWGPPKCGKSFWTFDALMHVVLGWEYRGRRVKQGAVVYVACEGERGLGVRAEAYRQERLAEAPLDIPFHLVTTRLNLPDEADQLVADIRAQLGVVTPALVAIDTLNRSIGGSENDPADMGDFVKATDIVREAFDCAVVVIHHCGIDGQRPRGHTSLSGAADAVIAVRQDATGIITATVEWMKDGVSGDVIACRLRPVTVGQDEDGEDLSSCVIEPAEPAAPLSGPELTPNQETMFRVLQAAGSSGLTLTEWNDRTKAEGVGEKRKATLFDCRDALRRKGLVRCYGDRWIADR